ncbi:hypothetical protein NON00_13630 [Roseomonas sp. GC11]|uniref:hypothetical protein n=1 Tax=Roseomonas sp. GC11 TaxID=2950546 RepID=UPI00210C1552|nr:hypothetical protein [Roseomonas sp. GC11]MCQ4160969.1 hypothetical protein [Roseomonas sp. GC11]
MFIPHQRFLIKNEINIRKIVFIFGIFLIAPSCSLNFSRMHETKIEYGNRDLINKCIPQNNIEGVGNINNEMDIVDCIAGDFSGNQKNEFQIREEFGRGSCVNSVYVKNQMNCWISIKTIARGLIKENANFLYMHIRVNFYFSRLESVDLFFEFRNNNGDLLLPPRTASRYLDASRNHSRWLPAAD